NVRVISLADRGRVLGRDHPDPTHRFGREHLDVPPDAVAVLGRPDGGHRGTRIAGDHAAPLVKGGFAARLARARPRGNDWAYSNDRNGWKVDVSADKHFRWTAIKAKMTTQRRSH